jgi:hypothetical protein
VSTESEEFPLLHFSVKEIELPRTEDGTSLIRACILPGMLTTKLDLSDAYFHIPISLASRKFLRFVWNNKVYQFLAVPFGLAVAPQVFTRVFQTVIAHLHTLSIQAHSYLDDSLLKEFDSEILSRHTFLFIRIVEP